MKYRAVNPMFAPMFAVVLCAVVGTAACGSDSTGPDNADIAGTYSLQTVSDEAGPAQSLPAEFPGILGGGYTFISGSLTIAANGTFTRTGSFTYSDIITDGDLGAAGTFTRSDDNLTFVSDDTDDSAGSVDSDEITIVLPVVNAADRFTFVFRKD